MKRSYRWLVLVCLLVSMLLFAGRDSEKGNEPAAQSLRTLAANGQVVDGDGPVAGARIRVQGKLASVLTDRCGQFQFQLQTAATLLERITVSKPGYLIQGVTAGRDPLRISLERLPSHDNADYRWVDPVPDPTQAQNCGNCHRQIYDEWHGGGHSMASHNRRFLSLYQGTDWNGQRKPGWSLVDDHPLGIGVCAACHAPGINFESGASDDMRDVTGVAARGVHCDYCHKIQEVDTERIGFAHGRFGHRLLRPEEGQLFFGPLDDVDRGEDTFSPLLSESRYCASCHEGVVFGIHVYSTYSEWLESPARQQGLHCQSCHMAPTGSMTNIATGNGGIERDPTTLASHSLMPGGIEGMLKRSVQVDVGIESSGDKFYCRVTLLAHDVGHLIPTGFVDRHLLLIVEPLDAAQRSVRIVSGPTLPAEAGHKLAGLPGRIFGRLLVDEAGTGPVPFWREGSLAHDTRLIPSEPETTVFALPLTAKQIRVRVLYRRFWQRVAANKRWPDDTVIVWENLLGLE